MNVLIPLFAASTLALAIVCTDEASAAEPAPAKSVLALERHFDITSQPLGAALKQFANQAGLQIMYPPELVEGRTSAAVKGQQSSGRALQQLLRGTGLEFVAEGTTIAVRAGGTAHTVTPDVAIPEARTWTLRLVEAAPDGPQANTPVRDSRENDPATSAQAGTPEILVKGKRTLNADILRTEDAPQPYVVFDSAQIQSSQVINLEEFLRTRLPMNTSSGSNGQFPGTSSTVSSINLRGLGANQTLILVDGRRIPGVAALGTPSQPDLNGIPLAAIERIEVLPSTASGIYGGSATGGVINIILRRDFQGIEARATYGNTFDTDAGNIRLDLSGGFALEGGRTHVMVAATHSEANNLTVGDRDFTTRAIALQFANNPAVFSASTTPPRGATVNIRAVSGNLVLDPAYGNRPLGSNITHIPLGYAGPASDMGAALLANAGRYNLNLPLGLDGQERGLVSAPAMNSVSLNLRREFGERLEAFLDVSSLGNKGSSFSATVPGIATNIPASAPNNPFQQAINVRFPVPGLAFETQTESTTARATGGLIAHLPRSWTAEVDYGWSRSSFEVISTSTVIDSAGSTSLNTGRPAPDGRPALNALQEGNTFPIDFTPYLLPSPNQFSGPYETSLKDVTLRASGPLMNLPAGPLTVSALIEHRAEAIEDAFFQGITASTRAPNYAFIPHRSQSTNSSYLETRIPLARRVELQVSMRRDEYETRGVPSSATVSVPSRDGPFPPLDYTRSRLDSTDYTVGLRYAPVEALTLRASFGTGFLPPSVLQIAPSRRDDYPFSLGLDPKRGNTDMDVGLPFTYISGGSPVLQPEHSKSWSAGAIFTPRAVPGFRLSIDYTRIEKADEIQPPDTQFLLDNEALFPGRIVRGANVAGDQPGWAGRITSLDGTLINVAKTTVEAYDIQADYTVDTEQFGDFHWYAVVTRQPHYRNQLLPAAAVLDSVGFSNGLLEWRGNAGLTWDRGPLTVGWNAQYYDSYYSYFAGSTPASITAAILNQGSATIPSQVYHDLVVAYRFDGAATLAGGVFAGSEIQLGIQNLFDRSPPIIASSVTTFSGYSTYGDPRLRRYTVSFRKSFGGQ